MLLKDFLMNLPTLGLGDPDPEMEKAARLEEKQLEKLRKKRRAKRRMSRKSRKINLKNGSTRNNGWKAA